MKISEAFNVENNMLKDDDNVLKFIDLLFCIFFKKVLVQFYKEGSDGKQISECSNNIDISLINLNDDVKSLVKWLDDSTHFKLYYNIGSNINPYGSSLRQYENDGILLIETNDNECKYKICNVFIPMTLNISINEYNETIILQQLSRLKEFLIHELSHAYTDYTDLINNVKHIKSEKLEKFDYAYSNIIKHSQSDNKDERYLCNVIYLVNDYESFAYISEFYQNLLNYIRIYKKRLNDISSYKIYLYYYNINKYFYIRFNNKTIFNKHKTDIVYIFGTSCKELKQFKININFITSDILDKLNKAYICAKNVEYDAFNNNTFFDVDEAEKKYIEYKNKNMDENLNNIRVDHRQIYEIYMEKYNIKPIDIQIKIMKFLIKSVS